MCKNLQCPSCSSIIAKLNNNKVVFDNMKAVSILEFSLDGNGYDVKCHTCHNWLNIDKSNSISVNYKRKGEDALYSSNTITFKQGSKLNRK